MGEPAQGIVSLDMIESLAAEQQDGSSRLAYGTKQGYLAVRNVLQQTMPTATEQELDASARFIACYPDLSTEQALNQVTSI